MEFKIALVKGDGIGPEIVDSAVRVLEKIGTKFGHEFVFTPYLIGGAAIDACGKPLPDETVQGCLAADSVLLGAVGGPKWDNVDSEIRPEKALLGLRSGLGLYANIRPVIVFDELKDASPLKNPGQIDFIIVRELTGGIYFGKSGVYQSGDKLADGTVKGKGGITYNQRAAICLETQKYPDTPNKPEWPSAILKPGEKYTSRCIYKFGVEK